MVPHYTHTHKKQPFYKPAFSCTQVVSSSQAKKHTKTHTQSHTYEQISFGLPWMILDCGRKLRETARTHADTKKKKNLQTPHKKGLTSGMEPQPSYFEGSSITQKNLLLIHSTHKSQFLFLKSLFFNPEKIALRCHKGHQELYEGY